MTTAIYLRTSTQKQEKGLQSQRRAILQYCKTQSIFNYKIYEDFGVSGAKSSRPQLNKLMSDARDGKISSVIVYSFSRFARSTKHLLQALDDFRSLRIRFISITEKIDTDSAIGQAFFVIISAISELERQLISERVSNGLKNARAKGKVLGRKRSCNEALILELKQQRLSHRKISELAKCSLSSVSRIVNRSKKQ